MEIWKAIEGYEGSYEVSNMGNVRSLERKVFMRWGAKRTIPSKVLKINFKPRNGYCDIQLMQKGKTYRVHRLVAQAFCPNPFGYDQVNHINGIKHDNRAENLEWCSAKQNIAHAMQTGLKINAGDNLKSSIKVTDANGKNVGNFPSIKAAAEALNIKYLNLSAMLIKGKMNYKGFVFDYQKRQSQCKV